MAGLAAGGTIFLEWEVGRDDQSKGQQKGESLQNEQIESCENAKIWNPKGEQQTKLLWM